MYEAPGTKREKNLNNPSFNFKVLDPVNSCVGNKKYKLIENKQADLEKGEKSCCMSYGKYIGTLTMFLRVKPGLGS